VGRTQAEALAVCRGLVASWFCHHRRPPDKHVQPQGNPAAAVRTAPAPGLRPKADDLSPDVFGWFSYVAIRR